MTLKELIEDLGYTTRSYSGRCMFGRNCLGVVVSDVPRFLFEAGYSLGLYNGENEDICTERPTEIRFDSMGLDSIVYFPEVEFD